MAVASWMLRSRTLRSGRFERSRKENDEDAVKLDLSKDAGSNCTELLEAICRISDMSEGKRVNYLNCFVKLVVHIKGNFDCTGFSVEDVLCCLRVSLMHHSTQVRAGCLRAVRHVLRTEEDVEIMNSLQFAQLIARSLDVVLRNELERIQALKLIRRALVLNPAKFDCSLARSLVSLANGVTEEKDRMLRACLAALCELAVLNAELFVECGGVSAITRNVLDCQMPRIVECLCGVLLHLLQSPRTRKIARVDLRCLAAPYCDFHYKHTIGWLGKRDERELRFNCSRLALLSVLRSWPGILHFCSPANTSGLKAVVGVLYLNQLEVRKAVLDLLYELLGLPQPEWTDEWAVALNAVDPSDPQDCWRLGEGFVAAEGRYVMPHLARTTPNIAEIHLALLLYVFLEVGLPGALVEVIISSDTFISVRATVLLGELLHLMHSLLPPECCDITPPLPGLLGHHRALSAVTALGQLHALLRRRPASSSLFLDHILRAGDRLRCTETGERVAGSPTVTRRTQTQQHTPSRSSKEDPDEAALRESGVLHSKDGFHTWNWNVIGAIVRRTGGLRLDDSNHRLFIRRLVHYFRPSSNRYSHMELTTNSAHNHTAVGCDLVRALLAISDQQPESAKLLHEWFSDVASHVDAISSSKSAHDCLFSPQHMSNTLCQTYFLFIGYACHESRGVRLISEVGLFSKLLSLATTTNHACYVKLIVSSFNYATDGPHRNILAKVLTCRQESSRLYATQLMLVLLRAGLPDFETWAVELLVNQLSDDSKAASLAALSILHEACEKRTFLDRLASLRPNLSHLGDKGHLLYTRLLSTPRGFRLMGGISNATAQITHWANYFIYRYVHVVEAEILDSLTLHQRAEDGRYDRRHSSARWPVAARRDVFVPPHLFGQLAQHEQGWTVLEDSGQLPVVISIVNEALERLRLADYSEKSVLELKAAMWACGHVSTSAVGVRKLVDEGVFRAIVDLAESCPVYSIRATAVYVLGIMGTTFIGANELFLLGWACVRHGRHERWPIVEEEDWAKVQTIHNIDFEDDAGTTASSSDAASHWPAEPWYIDEQNSIQIGRSSTLPVGQQQPHGIVISHKRSLSETQQQQQQLLQQQQQQQQQHQRHRDNSYTESTTSAVSSCDSALGQTVTRQHQIINNGSVNNTSSRLSPIPSSSSLSTLRTGLEMIRNTYCWTADGPRRVSLSNHSCSNSLTAASPPDVNGSRLSHQDLLGYNTLRTLRKVRASSFRSDNYGIKNTICGGGSSSGYEDSLVEDALFGGPSGSLSLGSTPRERIPIARDIVSPCYMGICLPRQLIKLFPDDVHVDTIENEIVIDNDGLGTIQNKLKHERTTCLLCNELTPKSPVDSGGSGEKEDQSDKIKLKIEILKHIERLSNPIWSKISKQALLHLKQRHANVFQDICLYSDMCSIISSSTFRLNSRRFLQELFLDLDYNELLAESNRALKERLFGARRPSTIVIANETNQKVKKGFEVDNPTELPVQSPTSPLSPVSPTSPTSISSTTSSSITVPHLKPSNITLKLTCNENKFPITHQRNQIQSVVSNSLLRSSLTIRDYSSLKSLTIRSDQTQQNTSVHGNDT